MADLYAVILLIPYVFLFLREQCTRFFSHNWETTQATVAAGTVDGQSVPYTAYLHYRYTVGNKTFYGCLSRMCLRKDSADAVAQYGPLGSPISIRYNPRNPERSYAPLPLGWGGFLFAAFPVFGFSAILSLAIYAGVQNRYIEAYDAIPASDWQALEANGLHALLPGTPALTLGFHDLGIDGNRPSTRQWTVIRNNRYFFYVEVLQYPPRANLTTEMFARVLGVLKAEEPRRYVYGDDAVSLEGRPGKEFKYTRPYTVMRVYLDGTKLYVTATDWYVDIDQQKFFDSFTFGSNTASSNSAAVEGEFQQKFSHFLN